MAAITGTLIALCFGLDLNSLYPVRQRQLTVQCGEQVAVSHFKQHGLGLVCVIHGECLEYVGVGIQPVELAVTITIPRWLDEKMRRSDVYRRTPVSYGVLLSDGEVDSSKDHRRR